MSDAWYGATWYAVGVAIGSGVTAFVVDSPRLFVGLAGGFCVLWLLGSLCYYKGKKAGAR